MSWMRTRSGLDVYYETPMAESICITDIAYSLSQICRFGGHVSTFYSVADHSIRVSLAIEEESHDYAAAFAGLMHDAQEAYLIDLPSPLKKILPQYQKIEDGWIETINQVFHINGPLYKDIVKKYDMLLCAAEARDLMGDPQNWEWLKTVDVTDISTIQPVSVTDAFRAFMTRYAFLIEQRRKAKYE